MASTSGMGLQTAHGQEDHGRHEGERDQVRMQVAPLTDDVEADAADPADVTAELGAPARRAGGAQPPPPLPPPPPPPGSRNAHAVTAVTGVRRTCTAHRGTAVAISPSRYAIAPKRRLRSRGNRYTSVRAERAQEESHEVDHQSALVRAP